jgi:hypothetical protein
MRKKYFRLKVHLRPRPASRSRGTPLRGIRDTKATRVDLGLALLSALILPGQTLTLEDIAAWCGCSRGTIRQIRTRAELKFRARLASALGNDQDLRDAAVAMIGRRAA